MKKPRFAKVSLKAPIIILLILMFLGKILLVDASLVQVLSGGEIRIERAYCKKKNSISENKRAASYAAETGMESLDQEIRSSCTPQFSFHLEDWNFVQSELIRSVDDLPATDLSYLYLDSNSPPPKFS